MRFESKLVASGLATAVAQGGSSTPAPTFKDAATGDYDNNKTTFDNIEINQVVLAPGNESAVLFTSNGAAYTVDQNADCKTGEDDSAGVSGTISLETEAIRRRKSHTRIQQEVEFWVPKTMAIGSPSFSGSAWDNSNKLGGYATCVVFAASDVAVFEWVKGNDGPESVPTVSKLSTKFQPTRVMCGIGGANTPDTGTVLNTPTWAMPSSMTDAEYHLHPTKAGKLATGEKYNDEALVGAAIPKLGKGGCGDTYAIFGMDDMICAVTNWKNYGYLMCLTSNQVKNKKLALAALSREQPPMEEHYPFTDPTGHEKVGVSGVLAADGQGDVLCRAESTAGNSTVSCTYPKETEDQWEALGNGGAGDVGQTERTAQGHGNCVLNQIAVLSRGTGTDKFVVYGVCDDGTLICAGGAKHGMKPVTKFVESACGVELVTQKDEKLDLYWRFDVTGYFMEPDQNAHKDDPDSAYAAKLYTTVGTDKFWSTRTALQTDEIDQTTNPDGAVEHFNDVVTSKTSGLYDGTMFDITASMTGKEGVACIKNSSTVLAIQTKSGRLLVNSPNLTFPYKYGVVFLTSPLQTVAHEVPALPYPSPTPIAGGYAGMETDGDLDLADGAANVDAGVAKWFNMKTGGKAGSGREEQGYEDYRDANVSEPGSFYQVMMKDMKNTQMPQTITGFTLQGSNLTAAATANEGTPSDVLWVAGNLGHSKVTQLANKWKDTPWLLHTDATAQSASGSAPSATRPAAVADESKTEWASWNGANDADTDDVAECSFKLKTGAVNLTFCLSSVGICSFHVSPYDRDALRDESSKIETYDNAGTVPSGWEASKGATAVNISEEMINHQWTNTGQNGMAPNLTRSKGVLGQCLSLYSFNDGCVLLTGIDDTNENMRNNDYFDCNIAVLVMNYTVCVTSLKPVWYNDANIAMPEENNAFNITYGDDAGSDLEKEVGSDKVMYMANTLRMEDESHLFQAGKIGDMTALNIEMRCACIYDIEQQVSAGILAASGSLGSATQNEVTTQFDVCIAIWDKSISGDMFTFAKSNNIYQQTKAANSKFVLTKCSQDPKEYGAGLAVGTVAGESYVILVSQDLRSLPQGSSFKTDAFIFPSNHANDVRMDHVKGTSGSPDLIDWDSTPDGTTLVKGNCGGSSVSGSIIDLLGPAATDNYGIGGAKTTAIPRGQFNTGEGSGNSKMNVFGISMNTTAWLGYSYNLFYVRTTRCQSPAHANCVVCAAARRRLLGDQQASARAAGEPQNFQLMMKNPKYIMDPAGVTGEAFNDRAEYDPFSSAVAVALFGLVSMLF